MRHTGLRAVHPVLHNLGEETLARLGYLDHQASVFMVSWPGVAEVSVTDREVRSVHDPPICSAVGSGLLLNRAVQIWTFCAPGSTSVVKACASVT